MVKKIKEFRINRKRLFVWRLQFFLVILRQEITERTFSYDKKIN